MKSEKNVWKSITVIAVIFSVLAIAMVGTASAKSLYVNKDIGTSSISAYDIQPVPTYLVHQADSVPTGYGGVGLAIDCDSEILFVTFEPSGTLSIVDAKTLATLGQVTAPDASNLAGIVFDQDNQKLYIVDRHTGNLYVYSWDATTKTLTLDSTQTLSEVTDSFGIALDEINDILYVADGSQSKVEYYDTNTWTHLGTITLNHYVIGIAVDAKNGFLYTGAGWYGVGLFKYDLGTKTETSNTAIRVGVMGLAVDPDTSLLYVTTGYSGDYIGVFDSNLNLLHKTGDIGNPTGIVVPGKQISYNPLNLIKDDGLGDDECVAAGGSITYDICFDNLANPYEVTNVKITDPIPVQTSFVAATGGGIYDPVTKTVTWDIGTLSAGAVQQCVQLEVKVDTTATPGSTITNSATIDSEETPPTTVNEITDVCLNQPPVANAGPDQWKEQDILGGAMVTLDGSGSSDPDGDALNYKWTWAGGFASGVSPVVILPMGITTVTLTVDDGQSSDTDTVDITVQDTRPPVLTCPPDVTVEQDSAAGTKVPLTATATDICDASPMITSDEPLIYPLGTTIVTFTATDDSGNSASCETTVTVVDTTAPEVACLETVNPHGNNIPGEKNWKDTNEDGFYELSAVDICDVEPELYLMSIDVVATANLVDAFDPSAALGPYLSGDRVKYTESNGATEISEKKIGSYNDQADAIDSHVKGPHDLVVFAMDKTGNVGVMTCLVPPPPK